MTAKDEYMTFKEHRALSEKADAGCRAATKAWADATGAFGYLDPKTLELEKIMTAAVKEADECSYARKF